MRYPPDFITQEAHARHGVEFECTHQSGTWLTTRRDILLLLSGCKFLTFTKQQRDSRLFRRIACPKSSTKNRNHNNFRAIFCIEGAFTSEWTTVAVFRNMVEGVLGGVWWGVACLAPRSRNLQKKSSSAAWPVASKMRAAEDATPVALNLSRMSICES